MNQVLSRIEPFLRKGGKLHGFLSGGGLRVLRLGRGYGESCIASEAMRILSEDLEAGGREYKDVYGPIETPYLTGASTPDDEPIDQWLRKGSTIDAFFDAQALEYVFELTGLEDSHTPKELVDLCTAGQTVQWTDGRGVTFETSPSRFPNGEACCMTKVISRPEGMSQHRAWMYYATRTGRAQTLAEAIVNAFNAERVEKE